MAIHVYIPTPFRRATNNEARVTLEAASVKHALDTLEARYAALKGLVRDEQGRVLRHVNIYVNSEAVDTVDGLATALKDGDEIAIIPALAGG